MAINRQTQEDTFKRISMLSYQVKSLAGAIRNDIESMLEDNMITKKDIEESIEHSNSAFDKVIEETKKLKEAVNDILTFYSK